MSDQYRTPHVFMQSNRIVLDAQALALATLLVAAAAGTSSCGDNVAAPPPPVPSTGGTPAIGPGVCVAYSSGGEAGSSSVADSGFVASGGMLSVDGDAAVGGASSFQTIPVGGVCAVQ